MKKKRSEKEKKIAREALKNLAEEFQPCFDEDELRRLYVKVFVERALLTLCDEKEAADSLGVIQEKIKERLKELKKNK